MGTVSPSLIDNRAPSAAPRVADLRACNRRWRTIFRKEQIIAMDGNRMITTHGSNGRYTTSSIYSICYEARLWYDVQEIAAAWQSAPIR